jgi:hypothetical protein
MRGLTSTRPRASIDQAQAGSLRAAVRAFVIFATFSFAFTLSVGTASATPEQAIAYFGTEVSSGSLGGQFEIPGDVAVNSTAAGSANKGDIYVIDLGNNRIQRFAQDDNGTPANPYDDSYPFISAWGAGVDSRAGGDNYEICTAAANCQAGVQTGGNGTVAGDGALNGPRGGIAVDQDTGNVYVTDAGNSRVNVYSGDGTFLRSFGFDVVESGPGNTGTGYEVCVAANGDVCKEGVGGAAGVGQITSGANGIALSTPDGNSATGTVFLADPFNRRVDTFDLDGASPSSFGSAADFGQESPAYVAVDSRGIVYSAEYFSGGKIKRYDSQDANGGGVGFLPEIGVPPLLFSPSTTNAGLEVKPDSDGAGPETDLLYVLRGDSSGSTAVQQFGPLNQPGLTAPPSVDDEEHGGMAEFNVVNGLGLDESSGRIFISASSDTGGPAGEGREPAKSGVYVLDKAGGAATASLESLSAITATSVTLHGKVNPNGPPDVSYRAEYSLDETSWTADPGTITPLGSQESSQSAIATIDPPGGGLEPNTLYHVRLVATRPFNPPAPSNELTFTTAVAPPLAETTGSPVRSATTAQLLGRVDPSNSPTSFHFEYGEEGPCDTNPCAATDPVFAGSGGLYEGASAQVSGLQPGVTYHYRIVADNGNSGSPAFGEDMTVTTRASDAPLSHGHFPGPPGSDRAYEQVSLPDTGGNPVLAGVAFSDDGSRAIYETSGGSPSSPFGGFRSIFLGERNETAGHAGAWRNITVMPPREELAGANFNEPSGPSDLSSFNIVNFAVTSTQRNVWRLSPETPPQKLFVPESPQEYGRWYVGSDDSTRAVALLKGGTLDPAYPDASALGNLYDISSGTPKLASLLPGNVVSTCDDDGRAVSGLSREIGLSTTNLLSADGKRLFFQSCSKLYMREFEAGQTKLISGPPPSGKQCGAILIKSTADAAFFWTKTRLTADDTNPASCGKGATDGDVYRYDIASGAFDCVTCVVPGMASNVYPGPDGKGEITPGEIIKFIAVAGDGSRIYFQSAARLTPGAPALAAGSGRSVYRVNVETGSLGWIAGPDAGVGDVPDFGTSVTPDGSVVVFRAKDPSLNPLGEGTDNGGTFQYYRYDDRDRSLVCVSCPPDGSPAGEDVPVRMLATFPGTGANITPLADDGSFAFKTTEALVRGDQNTTGVGQDPISGTDLYEWRDGRLLLVTDGLTDWPSSEAPVLNAINPSGRDIFFTAPTQYTQDALDAYNRLYDARIGGGFDFPPPPKPCPLEVCQGTPKGAPEEQPSGTANFAGPGNAPGAVRKKKAHKKAHKKKSHKGHKEAHQKKRHNRANDNRRTAR